MDKRPDYNLNQSLLVLALIFFLLGCFGGPLHAQSQEAKELYNEGLLYAAGEGRVKNEAKARALFEKASEKGHPNASLSLFWMLTEGVGGPVDFEKATRELFKAALGEVPEAQFNVGIMYLQGLGSEKSTLEALKWLKKAAIQGHRDAQYTLGQIYNQNLEVEDAPRNIFEAIKWFKMAAKQGDGQACVGLALIYLGIGNTEIKPDEKEAEKWIRRAQELGIDIAGKLQKASKELSDKGF